MTRCTDCGADISIEPCARGGRCCGCADKHDAYERKLIAAGFTKRTDRGVYWTRPPAVVRMGGPGGGGAAEPGEPPRRYSSEHGPKARQAGAAIEARAGRQPPAPPIFDAPANYRDPPAERVVTPWPKTPWWRLAWAWATGRLRRLGAAAARRRFEALPLYCRSALALGGHAPAGMLLRPPPGPPFIRRR